MGLAAVIGCHHDVKTGAAAVNLRANQDFEKCVDLAVGETFAYRFSAGDSVLFNVHYHQEKDVIHAVPEHRIAHRSGALEPRTSARYCLMWTNPNAHTTKLEYNYTIR